MKDLVEGIAERHGRLDCASGNTGTFKGGPGHEMSEQDWDEVCNINLKDVWLCMKYQVAQMLRQGGGVIVNNSSIYGISADANAWAYSPPNTVYRG